MNLNEEKEKLQKEAFDALKDKNFNAGIILATGVGKSKIMIDSLKAIYQEGMSILYCADNRKLRDYDFPNELIKWEAEYLLPIIDRLCYQSAYKLKDLKYDILLMDEGDYALTEQYIKLLENNTFKHIIFVSATLEKEKRKLIEQYIPIAYEMKMSDIEGQGIVNEARLYVVNYMLSASENNKYLGYNDSFKYELNKDKPNYTRLQYLQQGRKLFLGGLSSSEKVCQRLMKKLYLENERNKILIFCLLSEQADKVCKYSFHSKNAKDNNVIEMLDAGEIRVASVVGKVDRGINLNGVNNIIFEAPAESKTKLIQKSGRGRRLDADDMLDIYFLVPFYKSRRGEILPTVVQKWVVNSSKDLGLPFKIYKL